MHSLCHPALKTRFGHVVRISSKPCPLPFCPVQVKGTGQFGNCRSLGMKENALKTVKLKIHLASKMLDRKTIQPWSNINLPIKLLVLFCG